MKKLPSKYQIGDVIGECHTDVAYYKGGPTVESVAISGKIVAVRFTESGEYYDILTKRACIKEGIPVDLCIDMKKLKPVPNPNGYKKQRSKVVM